MSRVRFSGGVAAALGAALGVLTLGAGPLRAQAPPPGSDAYLDPTAAALHAAASDAWRQIDADVVRYTALVRQRIAAQLRTPQKDRTLY
ncbi:MAG: hypothetical protein KJO11_13400, partial [Gemmatimonadetes bacterium]|nr:hypothetical protein [Gemmatimonadota bacterium]